MLWYMALIRHKVWNICSKAFLIIEAMSSNVNMNSKKIIGLGLIALLLGLAPIPILHANAQQQDRVRSEQFVIIAERVREHAVFIRGMVASKGISTARMDALIAEADDSLKEAKSLLAENRISNARASAIAAMRKYTDSIKTLGETLRPEVNELEKERAEIVKREAERIERIRIAVRAVPDCPEPLKKEVNERLFAAEVAIKPEPVKRPEAQMPAVAPPADAPRLVKVKTIEALESVRKIENWQTTQRIVNYLRGIDLQIKKITEEIDRAEKGGRNVEPLQKKLAEVQELVESAKNKVSSKDVDGALIDAKKIQQIIMDLHRELKIPSLLRGR